jgi:hypothetical protein
VKIKLLLALALTFFAVEVSSADAYYYMTYRQAKAETAEFAAESCRRNCVESAAGPCRRRSRSAFSCVMIQTYAFLPSAQEEAEGVEGPVEVDCHTLLHWGVNYRGVIVLKRASEPHCFRR